MTAEEYLLQYRRAAVEVKHTLAEIERERQNLLGLRAIVYDDMPKSRDTERDLSAAYAVFEERAAALRETVERNAAIMADVEKTISRVKSPQQYAVLHMRYVEGLHWADIAKGMHRTRQAVYKIKRRALRTVRQLIGG